MAPFTHLHVASAYSLRYGVAQPRALAVRAAELGMDMLALTDRDGLYGAIKHIQACHRAHLKPIVGVDLPFGAARAVVLATGRTGWASLCRLVTAAHLAGQRGRPVADQGMLGDGLVVLLGPASDVGQAIAEGRPELAAARLAGWRARAEVVIEVVDRQAAGDGLQAARMIALADETGVPAVLTNAVRYLDRTDSAAAQVLDVSRKLVPLDRRHLDDTTGRAYLKSGAEMRRVAEAICGPDRTAGLLAETRRLAERCALDPHRDLGMGRAHLPEPRLTEGRRPHAELAARCVEGLHRRGLAASRAARERLEVELGTIARKGLSAYFLVVAEAAGLIRAQGIRCAIRGSGAGCLVNYLLDIGDLNPLEHNLLMERFLADSRPGLPDIDLDVESARRLEAYRAIFDRFGGDRVACVSMMETYRARSAIRDVGSAIGLPPYEIDAIAKAFPHIRARQIRAALADLPELRQSNLGRARLSGLFRIAEQLDGLPRHIALHPCGVLLSNATLHDRSPLERSLLEFPMSQFDKDDVEVMGLLKLDVIGIRMQSAMAHAVSEVARTTGAQVDLEAIPRADEPTYDMIRTSRTLGCFQIESPGQRELVAKLQPRDIEDLIVDISLFRPGPVNSDMVTPYLETRHGWRAPEYPHPDLAGILAESSGVVVFHEQVIRVLDTMTGCGLSEAEAARRRLADDLGQAEVSDWFRERALARGYGPDDVERVWSMLSAFGAFGFCKAHAASFALPTYQSAWLKRHHTAAFYAGVLTHEPGMYPKRAILDDARQMGIPILPLDINESASTWQVADGVTYGIRVALSEVKGISAGEIERIVAGRPYASLAGFWRRARVSRPVTERLVRAGAFDGLYGIRLAGLEVGGASGRVGSLPTSGLGRVSRRDLLAQVGALDRAAAGRASAGRASAGRASADRVSAGVDGQLALEYVPDIRPGELPEMTAAEAVEAELDVLGMDVSRHLLTFYTGLLDALGVVRSRDLLDRRAGAEVLVAGVKIATQTPAVRSGQRVIFATVGDVTGPVDVTFFESVQERCAATVFGSWLLVIRGRLRRTGGRAVSLNGTDCWDMSRLYEVWRRDGIDAVREALAPVPGSGSGGRSPGGRPLVYANGFELSPYADVGPAGGAVKRMSGGSWSVTK